MSKLMMYVLSTNLVAILKNNAHIIFFKIYFPLNRMCTSIGHFTPSRTLESDWKPLPSFPVSQSLPHGHDPCVL